MTEFFLWGSYGVSFAALALEVALLVHRSRKCERAQRSPRT
jgi:heme exporter protein CcmD